MSDRGSEPLGSVRLAIFLLAFVAGCTDVRPAGRQGVKVAGERTPTTSRPPPVEQSDREEMVEAVDRRINAYRESRGLESLQLDDDLSDLADEHSRRMAGGEVPFGHAGFEERARTIRLELSRGRLAENVGYNRGVRDPAGDAVERWLRSPQHMANVTGDFELTGIGIGTNARGEYYFTQIFLKPSE